MEMQFYNELINENNMKNRALARTNINVEALKKRIKTKNYEPHCFAKEFGNELLLILINYIVQKYHNEYGILCFSDGVERLYFYKEGEIELNNRVSVAIIDRGRYYLSSAVLENTEMLSSIINYAINGFETVEKNMLKGLENVYVKERFKTDTEKVLTIYQIITVGSCLGYFDVILDEKFLPDSEKFMMKYFTDKQFLIKFMNGFCKIDIMNGDIILANRIIKFKTWSNNMLVRG